MTHNRAIDPYECHRCSPFAKFAILDENILRLEPLNLGTKIRKSRASPNIHATATRAVEETALNRHVACPSLRLYPIGLFSPGIAKMAIDNTLRQPTMSIAEPPLS
ncbi:MAG: hypothetical protein R3C12_05340 [Planctomycetaceae bacterium]